jgi:APA family basic amino acid/polyamine antiporter
MVWSIVLVITGTFDLLTNLVIFAGFLFYLLLAVGLVRMKKRGLIGGKVPGYPVVPVIVSLFAISLIVNTIIIQPQQSLAGILLVLSGVHSIFILRKNMGRRSSNCPGLCLCGHTNKFVLWHA